MVRRIVSLAIVTLLVIGCGSSASKARVFGLIADLRLDQVTIRDADFLTGGAAEEAAAALGRDAVGDVFIQDLDTTQTFPLDASTLVTVFAYESSGRPSAKPYDLTRLIAVIGSPSAEYAAGLYPGDYYWLTIENGKVVKLENHKLP